MAVIDSVIEQKARQALRVLARRTHVRAAYLFGSQVEGTTDQSSDIDVAAFIDEADQLDLTQRVAISVETRQQAGDDVELHLFPTSSWRNPPKASFAQHILRHGTPLHLEPIEQFTGEGDYARERHAWVDQTTLEDIERQASDDRSAE